MQEERIRKILLVMVIAGGVIIAMVCTLYQNFFYRMPHHIQLSEYAEINEIKCEYDIDSITKENQDYDMISGWIIAKGQKIYKYDTKIILYTEDSDEGLMWLTKMVSRHDVTESINDGEDYDSCGFQALIPQKYIEGKEYKIAIAFYVDQEQYIVRTGEKFIAEEKGN